jgi:hypothetical protein
MEETVVVQFKVLFRNLLKQTRAKTDYFGLRFESGTSK